MSPSRIRDLLRLEAPWLSLIGASESRSRSAARRRKPINRLEIERLETRELMTAGYFDTSFDQTGKAVFSLAKASPRASATAEAVAIQSNGDIVIAGEVSPAAKSGDIAVIRLTPSGSLDTTFGINGREYLSFKAGGNFPDRVNSLTIDGSGRIVLAGTGTMANGRQEVVVVRLTQNGALDRSFGISGRSYANFSVFGATGYAASSVVVDAPGRIIVAGTATFANGHHDFGIIRLRTNGYFDTSFGNHGRSDANFRVNGLTNGTAAGVALDDFGRIVVAGTVSGGGQQHIGVIRLQTNGTWDQSFGALGQSEIVFSLNSPASDVAAGVVVDHQGRIVVAGESIKAAPTKSSEFVVGRLTPDGQYDATFGINGRSYAGFLKAGAMLDVAKAVSVDAWDRIIVAGSITDNTGNTDAAAIRLAPTGLWDTSFGISGRSDAGFDLGQRKYDAASTLAIDANGGIVLAGATSTLFSGVCFAVARIDGGSMSFDSNQMTIVDPNQTSVNGALYTDVTQGGAPTCWIDASIAELASKGVDLSQRIHYMGRNRYTVDLYDRNDNSNPWTGGFHPVTESVYFDGTRTSADLGFDPAQPGESWTVILQRAIIEAVAQYDPSQTITNPHSGGAGDAMSVLTGKWITQISPGAPNVAQSVMNALASGKNVTLGTPANTSTLVSGHWYGVFSANAQGITLYNPWGVLVTVSWGVVARDASDIQVN